MATTSVPKAMEALTLSKTKELKGVRFIVLVLIASADSLARPKSATP